MVIPIAATERDERRSADRPGMGELVVIQNVSTSKRLNSGQQDRIVTAAAVSAFRPAVW